MERRHPLDGDALAADAHYDSADEPEDDDLRDQSERNWNLCTNCEGE